MGGHTRRRILHLFGALGALGACWGCAERAPGPAVAAGRVDAVAADDRRSGVAVGGGGLVEAPAAAVGESLPGLHNVFAVSRGIFSGSAPEGEAGFGSLAAMGVRTVLSVDGARPDVERAHAHGMRYAHIPIGYDGMDEGQALEVARAIATLPGPVYVHCHHGMHRGPTAAAVAMIALGRMGTADAIAFMHSAGTSESYPGLWACARRQRAVSEADLAGLTGVAGSGGEIPEAREVSGLVEGMVAIDQAWERLKLARGAGWAQPREHPDVAPAAEAGILVDHFRVLIEDSETRAEGEAFVAAMRLALSRARVLEGALTGPRGDEAGAEAAFGELWESCRACHEAWRN